MWLVTHVSPPSADVVKMQRHFLVSLPPLSNQDRELQKQWPFLLVNIQRAGSSWRLSLLISLVT